MGDLEARDIAAATPHFFKGVSDAVSKERVEYYWLEKNNRIFNDQSGRGFEWRFRARRGTPIGYSGVEGINFTARNDFEVAALPYRGIADGIMLTWQELEQCRGPEAIFKLTDELTDGLESDLGDRLSTDFYGDGTSLGSKTIHGLAASIASGKNLTYAGVSQSTVPAFANQYVSGAGFSGAPLAKCNALKIACQKGEKGGKSRNRISIFLTDGDTYQTVGNALQAQQRFVSDKAMADAGFESVMVWGVPMSWSEYAPAGKIWGLNHKLFGLYTTTSDLFKSFAEWIPGMPKVFVISGVSCLNLINMNPRGSGLIDSIT